ncbi:alpha-hydroxy acid oxidase [Pseudomonas sp. CCI3.2]|uniref:alpha-hydroxy acid oxidase n=1 Tax=unclassified Pseudomonas TaxID=196821 RepID=UPI002AC94155|nr:MULTISPECIES: alpha-hydroxy acid oxidase [unclassified Pseudomonas]MEB0078999.1 alpha-hydroxy acid oxidase [Pseudomonas sp. MH10out]MEB0094174.1 alpha-hydroxy acid oxidase [Pseudomonas sp. CCI4.2]MEB0103359.1 alpha-hydroxy acid oxidase [Pseudomonas sp. CCI3.2]MEB0132714.1 alpha-hydroxy acid oxidase [Pseudomonas sp. CCI2.4]MEB0159769.1 alpha-hydroxy acid oxidase [Pseudomonas sp. AH2 (2023)]
MRRYHTGSDFRRAHSIAELASMAHQRLPIFAWEYLEGGAEEEVTLKRNRQAFSEIGLLPQTLVPCLDAPTRCCVLGASLPLPMVIGPTGYNGMLYREADIQLARAATARGLPFTLSTVSTSSLEQVVTAVPGVNLWFQLYCFRDPAVQSDLLKRADAVGCKTLLLTSDAVLLGNREWDKRNFVRPRHLSLRNKLDVLRHPRWIKQALWPHGLPIMANVERYLPADQRTIEGAAHFIGAQMDTGLDWNALARLRDSWPHRLVLKGVLHPADAEKAIALGLDGLVVSNHGGRQLDGAPASIECLPAIAAVAKGKLTLLLDSGVRRGTDVLKACALGADAVLLGRATLYGVAVGGQAGAGHALDLLAQELRLALSLLGKPDLSQLDHHDLRLPPNLPLFS